MPDERTTNNLWTTTFSDSNSIMTIHESGDGGLPANGGAGNENCRCVRLGEGETSEGSSGSSNSSGSGSSILGSEQPITMIDLCILQKISNLITLILTKI